MHHKKEQVDTAKTRSCQSKTCEVAYSGKSESERQMYNEGRGATEAPNLFFVCLFVCLFLMSAISPAFGLLFLNFARCCDGIHLIRL